MRQRSSGARWIYWDYEEVGWGARIRTWEWRYQKPLPYRLATPQCRSIFKPSGYTWRLGKCDQTKWLSRFRAMTVA